MAALCSDLDMIERQVMDADKDIFGILGSAGGDEEYGDEMEMIKKMFQGSAGASAIQNSLLGAK